MNHSLPLSVFLSVFLSVVLVTLLGGCATGDHAEPADGWIRLFNGRDLDGWQPKFSGYELGANHGDTFRVEDGVLKVAYDEYENFDGKFGHLFYRTPYSQYRLRVEYRFVGDQVPGGPGWAFRNNGLMLHCQPPETMTLDQEFPASIEVQLLGGRDTDTRTTANLCTPGTHVVMNGELVTRHCTNSTSKTYHGDQWVTVEVEVRGSVVVRHFVEGETVLTYSQPQLDDQAATALGLGDGDSRLLESGYIAIQAESHPTEFRVIELQVLDP